MTDLAIQVDNLSKLYRIAAQRQSYNTLRDTLADGFKSFFRPNGQRATLSPLHSTLKSKLSAQYDTFWALRDVSFEVKRGDVLGIIGRNGAGKSTLLKILSRVTRPTQGRAKINGRVGSLLEVGTGFHPELTGRENIYLNGAVLGMTRTEIQQKFHEIVEFAEIEQFLDTPVKRYSSGMYMRLAFAVAAHLEPEILLVDEVLAVGDAAFQKKCLGKMGEVAKEGRTVLFVSHNMAAVQALCQRGIFLRHGTVWKDASATEAIGTYLQTLQQDVSQDLLERTERSGKGEVKLERVDISTHVTNNSNTLSTGSPARFVFHLTNVLPKMACLFTIYDHFGQPVAHFNSDVHSPADSVDSRLGTQFICQLDELVLLPGRYRINVAITSDGQLQDHVEAATFFGVEQGTVRGRPVTEGTGYGSVFLHHRWTQPASTLR